MVTAADQKFMPFLDAMLESTATFRHAAGVDLACFDAGLSEGGRFRLRSSGVSVAQPRAEFGLDQADHSPALLSFLARPFLPEYFPGYGVYLWVDSDIWLQQAMGLQAYVQGADEYGMAIAHEGERAYRFQPRLFGWTAKHFVLGYGVYTGAKLLARRHVNAGLFAIRGDAPHWSAWARRYEAAIHRSGRLVPHDQFALNQALHEDIPPLPVGLLDPVDNWICARATPLWDDRSWCFCHPLPPHARLNVLHLAGPAKRTVYSVQRTGGGSFNTLLVRGASPETPVTALPSAWREGVAAVAEAADPARP